MLFFYLESEIEGKNQEATELRFDEIIVPLIYTDDSKEHRDNVYKLRDKLEKCGVTILLADDDSCPEVTSNWVDFTENMAKSYKTFVFVVSPLLFRLCHEGKHGNEKSFQSLIGKTKGIHVPSILLRNLEALDARNWRTPRICLVELTELYYNRIRNLNTRTEDVGSSLATNAATSRVEARAKTVTRSADEVSEFTQEDTLSNKLMIDYNILYNACCFTVPAEDLTEDLGSSRPRALHDLSKWLID